MHACSVTQLCLTLLRPHAVQFTRLPRLQDSPGKNTGVGCHFLLQGTFLTQGLTLHLLHWQVDSLPLSHLGSPAFLYMYAITLHSAFSSLILKITLIQLLLSHYYYHCTMSLADMRQTAPPSFLSSVEKVGKTESDLYLFYLLYQKLTIKIGTYSNNFEILC